MGHLPENWRECVVQDCPQDGVHDYGDYVSCVEVSRVVTPFLQKVLLCLIKALW